MPTGTCNHTVTRSRDCKCCCRHCEHDQLTNCPLCCRCVPRFLCVTFIPDDITANPVPDEVQHIVDGAYGNASIGIKTNLIVNGDGDCVWSIAWDQEGEGNDVDEDFLVSTYGCLTDEGDELVIDDVTYVVTGDVGTIKVTAIFREIVPPVERINGCFERPCANCTFFPSCACIRYNIEFLECDDDDNPGDQPDNVGAIRRVANVCWDPDVGIDGGWLAEFDAILDVSCSPDLTLLIEIIENKETGNCDIVLTTSGANGPDPHFDQEPSQTSLNCTTISNQWEWGASDATTGTGSLIKCGTGTSLLTLITVSINTENCDDCEEQCCEYLPETLTATIFAEDCTTANPTEIILTRNDCHSAGYGGRSDVPWECVDDDEGPGTGSVTMIFTCVGCVFDHLNQKCACDCVGTEDPGIQGCGILSSFRLFNFDGFQIGNALNETSECGVTCAILGSFSESTCDPIYSEFCVSVQGLGDCCDFWTVIVTE